MDLTAFYITYRLLNRTINVKSCKVHRAVYDRLTEVLEQLKKLNYGREIDDELIDNISLITRLIDGLYITAQIAKARLNCLAFLLDKTRCKPPGIILLL